MPFELDLVRILEATRAITSTLQLSELLKTVIRLAGEVVGAEVSSLLLLDPITDELYFDVALGEKGGALQQVRLKKGEGIAGWVAENKKRAVVDDVSNDPRWTKRADKKTQFQTRSILAVPMLVKEKLIGVMEAINRADGQPFSASDTQMLELFASQAAVAIENARLFESIRQEKEKMATILDAMAEGVVLLNPSGHMELTNPASRTLLDHERSEVVSWPDLEKTFEIKPLWTDAQEEIPSMKALELRRRDGPPLILAGAITTVLDDRGQKAGFVVLFSDVTEERREASLKKNFLSLVSHKLNTPLVAIRGFAPLLLENPSELNAFQKTAYEAIDRSSQQLASIVEKMVWFSALEGETLPLDRKVQALKSVLDQALSDLSGWVRTFDAVIVNDPSLDGLPVVSVDKWWMKETFRNLIENAIKFNSSTPRHIRISGRAFGGYVDMTFDDNGPGIPPEERQKIFNKFYQIESSFTGQVQGMGLGLALVKRVVEEHGGQVHLQSALGQGSSFTVRLPLA